MKRLRMTHRPLTGRAVLAMFLGGFGTVIAVNVTLATHAVRTFPGLEVANSYVASQSFDRRRAAQEALGWQVSSGYEGGGLRVALTDRDGRPLPPPARVRLGRPTEARDDRVVALDAAGRARTALAPGLWHVNVAATAPDGTAFARRLTLRVAP